MGHLTDIIDWIRNKTTSDACSTDSAESITDFSAYTVSELKDIAKDRGLKGYSSLRKADLVKLLSS